MQFGSDNSFKSSRVWCNKLCIWMRIFCRYSLQILSSCGWVGAVGEHIFSSLSRDCFLHVCSHRYSLNRVTGNSKYPECSTSSFILVCLLYRISIIWMWPTGNSQQTKDKTLCHMYRYVCGVSLDLTAPARWGTVCWCTPQRWSLLCPVGLGWGRPRAQRTQDILVSVSRYCLTGYGATYHALALNVIHRFAKGAVSYETWRLEYNVTYISVNGQMVGWQVLRYP